MSNLLHYDCLDTFKHEYFKHLLTREHLQDGQVKIDKMSLPDGSADDEANFWGYVLNKNGKKYLLSAHQDGKDIDINKLLPILPDKVTKVASKGVVYYHIHSYKPARFKVEKKMSFRTLVDKLSAPDHSSPEHQKLMWFIGLASLLERVNFRMATPPGFGKDSVVETLGCLFGSCATVENPTIAKLEFMTTYKWLAVNEVVDIKKDNWTNIEHFLLATGAHKPEVTKHSRATSGVKEVLNIKDFSISLMYNDIDEYKGKTVTKYFDAVTKGAVLDRFPAFRFHGRLTQDFNSVNSIDIPKYVKENQNAYKDLIYTLSYYKENLFSELKGFKSDGLSKVPERWLNNIQRMLRMVDLYCTTQEEYNEWIKVINDSLADYEAMLLYPDYLDRLMKKLTNIEYDVAFRELKKIPTFMERNRKILKVLNPVKVVRDIQVNDLDEWFED